MRIPRIYLDEALRTGASVHLPEQATEHVARVLRLEAGDRAILFNGDGCDYDAELTAVTKRAVTAIVAGVRSVSRESPLPLTLVQGIARGDKMDWIIQKATELGVTRIVPVVTERTEVKLGEERAERRMAHWQHVIVSACELSGRNVLPQLEAPQKLHLWLAQLGDRAGRRLALLPDGDVCLGNLSVPAEGVLVAVGPEGGFSEHDEAGLHHAGFAGLRLGPRILRTETAGLAALAALQALGGDLR